MYIKSFIIVITTSFVCLLHHIFQVMVDFFILQFIFTKLGFINLNYSNNYKWPINKNILRNRNNKRKECPS